MDSIAEWVIDVIDALGPIGVLVLVALESVVPPIPSEVVLASAGVTAGRGSASLVVMILAATTGSMIGAWALYGIGAAVGPERLRDLVERRGAWLRISVADLERAERWFDRHAELAVLGGRCVPLVRSVVSVPAGFRRMPIIRFSLCTFVGSLVWNTAIISAGYVLGENWVVVEEYLALAQLAVLAVVAVLVVRFVVRRRVARRSAALDADRATMSG